jgi:hypothetical protein
MESRDDPEIGKEVQEFIRIQNPNLIVSKMYF